MILLLWSPPEARAATNDVANPSFEPTGASPADAVNWTEGTNHARSNDKVHSGNWALRSSYTSTRSDPDHRHPEHHLPQADLHASNYDWQFVPEAGQTWTDSASTSCH